MALCRHRVPPVPERRLIWKQSNCTSAPGRSTGGARVPVRDAAVPAGRHSRPPAPGAWRGRCAHGASAPAGRRRPRPVARPTPHVAARPRDGPVPGRGCRSRTPGCAARTRVRWSSASARGGALGGAGGRGRSYRPGTLPAVEGGVMYPDYAAGVPDAADFPGQCQSAQAVAVYCVFGGHAKRPLLRLVSQRNALRGPYEIRC